MIVILVGQAIPECVTFRNRTTAQMLEVESTRLTATTNNREFDGTGTAEVLVTATSPKLVVLKNQLIKKL